MQRSRADTYAPPARPGQEDESDNRESDNHAHDPEAKGDQEPVLGVESLLYIYIDDRSAWEPAP